MKDIELPPLPAPFMELHRDLGTTVYDAWAAQMQAYARAAVEADRAQRVPDGLALVPVEPTRSMVDAAERIDWGDSDVRGNIYNMWNVMLASTPAQPAQQEPSEAEMVCAEAYQVVGCLLSDLGLFETEAARKILDNLSEARMVHQDVLPWESAACAERDDRIAELEKWQAEHWNALEIINNYFLSKDLLLVVEDGGPDAAARNIVHSVAALEQQLEEARKDAMHAAALICDALPAPPSCNVLERNLWDVATVAAADAIRAAIKEQTK